MTQITGATPMLDRRLRRIYQKPAAIFLVVLLVAVAASALLGNAESAALNLRMRNLPPAWASPDGTGFLGTDSLGRDLATRLGVAARSSILISFAVVVLAATIGTAVGLTAALSRRWIGVALMRTVDGLMSFPGLLLAIIVLFVLGPGMDKVIGTLSALIWPAYARVAFADALKVREEKHVAAARVSGVAPIRIALRYVLPGIVGPILALSSIQIGAVMLVESSLSFLGLGIQPPGVSWGLMIAEGRSYFPAAWHVTLFPGLMIALTAVSLNVTTAGLATRLDPIARSVERSRRGVTVSKGLSDG
jgi:peptide/nickel transport system permease protein